MPEDMALSRDHFMIEINPPQCEIRDLGSTNGTFVNNNRVDRVRLVSGDVIAAGQSVFRVEVELAHALSSSEGSQQGGHPHDRDDHDGPDSVRGMWGAGTPESDDRGPASGGARRESRMVVRPLPLRSRGTAPAGSRITRPCESSAAGRWASSIRLATTSPARWSLSS